MEKRPTLTFFFGALPDPHPPPTFLIWYVFSTYMFSVMFFGAKIYAFWVVSAFMLEKSSMYWWGQDNLRGVLLDTTSAEKAQDQFLLLCRGWTLVALFFLSMFLSHNAHLLDYLFHQSQHGHLCHNLDNAVCCLL